LYEAIQDESVELCFIFHIQHSVLYLPKENIVPEIVLHIRYNKPRSRTSCTKKYCTRTWSWGQYSSWLPLVLVAEA